MSIFSANVLRNMMSVIVTMFIAVLPTQMSLANDGYWTTNDGSVILSGKGECWQSKDFDPASAPEVCGGTPVEEDGDSDGDGVSDSKDQCPGTPNGVAVDEVGCPLDSDGDGVADYLDQCPNTPSGVAVDSDGCPLDSDGDGVPDYKDKCPGTPAGRTVDADGCEISLTLSGDVLFDTDSAELRPEAYTVLDNLYGQLSRSGVTQINIIGHADSRGTDDYNQRLSVRRAESVRQYLINKGANASGLRAMGQGESSPVADNSTAEGRAMNRRVNFEVLE